MAQHKNGRLFDFSLLDSFGKPYPLNGTPRRVVYAHHRNERDAMPINRIEVESHLPKQLNPLSERDARHVVVAKAPAIFELAHVETTLSECQR